MILVASYLSDSYMSHFSAIFFEKIQKKSRIFCECGIILKQLCPT